MHSLVFKYSKLHYLKTKECILLDWIMRDLIIDNAQYEQYKKIYKKVFVSKII
jgi:hypothetical protein